MEFEIDQTTKKNDVENKSDFETDVRERMRRCGPTSLVQDRPLGAKSKHQDHEKRDPRDDRSEIDGTTTKRR